MKDEIKEVLEGVNLAMEVMIEDGTIFKNIAKVMRKLYNELLDEGFTEDQAASIVSNYKATGN